MQNHKTPFSSNPFSSKLPMKAQPPPPAKQDIEVLETAVDVVERKSIEVLVVPKSQVEGHQKNVAITIDQNLIKDILSKFYSSVVITEVSSENCLEKMAKRRPDLVFSGVKYFDFEEQQIWLNDFLDQQNISYIGSNHSALDKEHDKSTAKETVRRAGVVTADYFTAGRDEVETIKSKKLVFPVFVKPIRGGDSLGIDESSIAFNKTAMIAKIEQISDLHNCRSIIESYLTGREFSVGILEDELTGNITAMPIEIVTPKNKLGHRILDYDVKKSDTELVKRVVDKDLLKQLSDLGTRAFRALEGRSFGRIDIRLCSKNIPHFMEANLMPGLSKGYFFRSCAINLGISYEQMIHSIAQNRLKQIR